MAASGVGFIDGPNYSSHQQDDVDDDTRVERHTQRVHEEQFKPSADGDDTWHNAIKHGSHDDERDDECHDGTFGFDVGEPLVAIHQHDGGDAEQVQQMNADRQAGHIGDEYQPTVAVRLIGVVFPFQDEPEYDGRESRTIGVNLTFDSREPECVRERVNQGAHQSAGFNGNQLGRCQLAPVFQDKLTREMRDCPKEEQDGGGREQRAHDVHHSCHLARVAGEL